MNLNNELKKELDIYLFENNTTLYWTKSMLYPLELITREEWIGVKERLRIYRENDKAAAHRRTEKSIGTGIITCGYCGIKYFYQLQAVNIEKTKSQLLYYSVKDLLKNR